MRPQRQGQTFLYFDRGYYRLRDVFYVQLHAGLGCIAQIACFYGGVSPAILGLLVGTTFILRQEDG